MIFRGDVSRVSLDSSLREKEIDSAKRLKEGRQVQHIMASKSESWNTKNAYDVIADALLLSAANEFIHVNSNIATIVSIFNPNIEMYHIKHGDDYLLLRQREWIIRLIASYSFFSLGRLCLVVL